MKCKMCNREIDTKFAFCPYCGEKVDEYQIESQAEEKPAKVWFTFARLSKIFVIISISICFIPFMALYTVGIPGIVFGVLGKRAKTPEALDQCRTGFVMSLVGIIMSAIAYGVMFLLFESLYF